MSGFIGRGDRHLFRDGGRQAIGGAAPAKGRPEDFPAGPGRTDGERQRRGQTLVWTTPAPCASRAAGLLPDAPGGRVPGDPLDAPLAI